MLIVRSLVRERGLFVLWIASLCIAVTGLLVVDVFRHSLTHTLQVQGRKILTADVAIGARRPLTDSEKKDVREALPPNTAYSESTEMFAMISSHGPGEMASRLGQTRFIDEAFPLAGDFLIGESEGPARPATGRDLAGSPQAWVAPDLLTLMELKIGDPIKIGEVEFKISGVVRKDSSQTLRFGNMAPRLYLARRYLDATQLIKFGSTFSETLFARTVTANPEIKKTLEKKIQDPAIQVTVPTDLEQGSFRVLSRLLDFLGLTGLVTLCLGWIGVYYLGRRWLSLEARAAGILKCLGYSARELRLYLIGKLSLIMVSGIVCGGALAWLAARLLFPAIKDSLPGDFILIWSWPSTLLLLLVGPLSGLLLLLPAILAVSREMPLRLVYGTNAFHTSRWDFAAFSLTTAALFFFVTLAQARSWKVTFIFLGTLLATVLVIATVGFLSLRLMEKLKTGGEGWRAHLALSMWTRRRSLAVLMITVSAMSGLLSQLVPNLEKTLVGELQAPDGPDRPALFLFDIQDEQLAPLKDFLADRKIETSQSAPFIRARILKVNEQNFERTQTGSWSTREEEMDARFRNRGVNLSYRAELSPAETIRTGKVWSAMKTDPALSDISVEDGYADRLKLKLGDILRFDVQGSEFETRIASLREVNWNSFEPNFFIVFPMGVLDDAPKTWIMTIKRHPTLSAAQMQALVAGRFANVTSINVQEALDNAAELFRKLSGGLKLASGLCLALGIFVFLMILLFQLASSQKDWMQLRILGLDRLDSLSLQIMAYGGLCVLGSLLGAVMSLAVAFALSHFAFEAHLAIDWRMMFQIFGLSTLGAGLGMIVLAWRFGTRASLHQLIAD